MSVDRIYHFADPDEWDQSAGVGEYHPQCLLDDGFIHAATQIQIPGVVSRHLRGRGERIKLTLNVALLGQRLKFERNHPAGDLFPHIYGAIPLNAVVSAERFDPDCD